MQQGFSLHTQGSAYFQGPSIPNPQFQCMTSSMQEVFSYIQHALQTHDHSMMQTQQEMDIIRNYLTIQERRMAATRHELQHLHHMLRYWETTTYRDSSLAAPGSSYYDVPANRQHESNTVINNAELATGIIPNLATPVPPTSPPRSSSPTSEPIYYAPTSHRVDRHIRMSRPSSPYVSLGPRLARRAINLTDGIFPPPRPAKSAPPKT